MTDYITIDQSNLAREHVCCAIGNDAENRARAETKKSWMAERLAEGLVFRRLDARGKCFVETMPIERAWKPVEGVGAVMIHCLWVSGQFKGHGHAGHLLASVIDETKRAGRTGVAVITSAKVKPFLTDKRFFVRYGFAPVDTAPLDFELLWRPQQDGAAAPHFTLAAKAGTIKSDADIAFVYTNQCPFMEHYTDQLAALARNSGFSAETRKLTSAADVRASGSAFGTLGIYHRGRIIAHDLIPPTKFPAFLKALPS